MNDDLQGHPPAQEGAGEEIGEPYGSSDAEMGMESLEPVEPQTPSSNGYHEVEPAPPPKRESRLRPILVEILQTILLTLIIFLGVRSVVQNYRVEGASMEPSFFDGEYLLVNRVAFMRWEGLPLRVAQGAGLADPRATYYYPFGGPHRGDVIVFHNIHPGEPDLIKRIIGLPGDRIQVDRGRVSVNGVQLQESYIRALPSYSVPAVTVPPDELFVLGDNRPNSSDSHLWGFLPESKVVGKAWATYWPPGRWGMVPEVSVAAGR